MYGRFSAGNITAKAENIENKAENGGFIIPKTQKHGLFALFSAPECD
jgi:hypothetical protein